MDQDPGGTLRLDPFCDWLLLAAQSDSIRLNPNGPTLRCAEIFRGSVCSFLAPQKYLAEASVIFGQSRSETWRYDSTLPHVHIESTVYEILLKRNVAARAMQFHEFSPITTLLWSFVL